jgi:hypothetical protein
MVDGQGCEYGLGSSLGLGSPVPIPRQHSSFKDDNCPLKNQRQKKSPYQMTSISTVRRPPAGGQVWSASWRILSMKKSKAARRAQKPAKHHKLFIFSAQTTSPSSNQKTTFHL